MEDARSFFGDRINFTGQYPSLLWGQWQLGVAKYSPASLTKAEDRIVALAGIAKECREAIWSMARSGNHRDRSEGTTPTIQLDADSEFLDAYIAGL